MARKPNYGFERRQREEARARKKADRKRAKQEKLELRKAESGAEGQKPGTDEQELGAEIAPPAEPTE